MPNSIAFFAITTRGLEDVSAGEIGALPGVTVTAVGYRRVAGIRRESSAPLLCLRTVGDVFLHLATWNEIGRPRSTLARLCALGADLDLTSAVRYCASIRHIAAPPTFSVTANFVGRRNYRTEEIKDAVATGITRTHGWRYEPDDGRADLNVRVFIAHERAEVGVRLGKTPLHDRPTGAIHRPGALKAPVAAALLRLAGARPGQRVLDPCCGTGTIPIEAAALGAMALAGDNNADAIRGTRQNAARAGNAIAGTLLDARALPFADGTVEYVVTNPPWGRQVHTDDGLAAFYRQSLAEMGRVLAPGGRIVLLTGIPDVACTPGFCCIARREISLHGQTPRVMIFRV